MSNRVDAHFSFDAEKVRQSTCTTYSSKSVFNSVTAGYVAGICGVVVGHPLDSIKVMLQTNPGTGGASPATVSTATSSPSASASVTSGTRGLGTAVSSSTSAASTMSQHSNMSTVAGASARQASASRSVRALYAGMTGPLLTVGVLQSTYFAIYDSLRRVLHHQDFPDASSGDYLHNDSLSNVAYASALAGSVTTVLTSPLMVVKTKQQIMVWGFRKAVAETKNTGPSRGLSSLRNFYVGFVPHFFAVTFGRSLYMTVYEVLKRSITNYRTGSSNQVENVKPKELSLQERMLSASIAGMVCWAAIFPLDVIQNKMYQQTLHGGRKSSWELTREMYSTSGGSLKPFFRGFGLTVLRAGPVAAVVLPVYDMSLEWLASC